MPSAQGVLGQPRWGATSGADPPGAFSLALPLCPSLPLLGAIGIGISGCLVVECLPFDGAG